MGKLNAAKFQGFGGYSIGDASQSEKTKTIQNNRTLLKPLKKTAPPNKASRDSDAPSNTLAKGARGQEAMVKLKVETTQAFGNSIGKTNQGEKSLQNTGSQLKPLKPVVKNSTPPPKPSQKTTGFQLKPLKPVVKKTPPPKASQDSTPTNRWSVFPKSRGEVAPYLKSRVAKSSTNEGAEALYQNTRAFLKKRPPRGPSRRASMAPKPSKAPPPVVALKKVKRRFSIPKQMPATGLLEPVKLRPTRRNPPKEVPSKEKYLVPLKRVPKFVPNDKEQGPPRFSLKPVAKKDKKEKEEEKPKELVSLKPTAAKDDPSEVNEPALVPQHVPKLASSSLSEKIDDKDQKEEGEKTEEVEILKPTPKEPARAPEPVPEQAPRILAKEESVTVPEPLPEQAPSMLAKEADKETKDEEKAAMSPEEPNGEKPFQKEQGKEKQTPAPDRTITQPQPQPDHNRIGNVNNDNVESIQKGKEGKKAQTAAAVIATRQQPNSTNDSSSRRRSSNNNRNFVSVGTTRMITAFTIPDCESEPSPTDYQKLTKATHTFFEGILKKKFKDSFGSLDLSIEHTEFGQNKPTGYNVYVEWEISGQFTKGPAPDHEKLCHSLARKSDISKYFDKHLDRCFRTPFRQATGATVRALTEYSLEEEETA